MCTLTVRGVRIRVWSEATTFTKYVFPDGPSPDSFRALVQCMKANFGQN
jgi:hypothetical protein